jgi:predicted nucleotidyltransferase
MSAQSAYDRIQYYKIGRKQKASIVAKLKALFDKDDRVKFAVLFGSLTRGDNVRDVDVAIHVEPELAFRDFLDLNAQIELKLGMPVDLVEIAKAPAEFRESILRNGTLLKGTKIPTMTKGKA